MELTIVLLLGGLFILFLTALLYVKLAINKLRRSFTASLLEFFSPKGNQPSEFARLVDAVSAQLAEKIAAQFKATFMGIQSGESRLEKAITGDIAQDMVANKSPLIGQILQSFPSVGKRLMRNPAALPILQTILNSGALSKILGGAGGQGEASYHRGNSKGFAEMLGKYNK